MKKKRYNFNGKVWEKSIPEMDKDGNESLIWKPIPITNVPLSVLLEEYEDLILELSEKEIELEKVKTEYAEKEFSIKYLEDIDFKKLYGKANDDTRKHHVQMVCSDLLQRKQGLELSVDFLKRYVGLLKTSVSVRKHQGPICNITSPIIDVGAGVRNDSREIIKKAFEGYHEK